MRSLLLAAAALAAIVPATPAIAEHGSPSIHRDAGRGIICDGRDFRRDRDRDRHRRIRDCVIVGGNLGYLDYGDYDAHRSFDADKWNDWWHERPWRAYPRWVQTNDNCAPERMWWSGSGWHC